jgi:hypothetical protein
MKIIFSLMKILLSPNKHKGEEKNGILSRINYSPPKPLVYCFIYLSIIYPIIICLFLSTYIYDKTNQDVHSLKIFKKVHWPIPSRKLGGNIARKIPIDTNEI